MVPTDIHFDFEALLVLLAAFTGLIWLADKLWLAPHRGEDDKEPLVIEYGRSFFPVILFVLVLRSFVVEPFRIPSGSMEPTLQNGDFILVNKFTYGLRLPVLFHRFVDNNSPTRGDVVVFRFPQQPEIDYIKRVIGLPGDVVVYRDKQLYVNGELQQQTPLENRMVTANLKFTETLTDGAEHLMQINPLQPQRRTGPWVVPAGHYFVMGDNRDNSRDGRFWGYVPERNLVGKAFFIWMNWDPDLGRPDWGRIGETI